jgi:hypothetical protein
MRFFAIVSVFALSGCSSESGSQKSGKALPKTTGMCPNEVTKVYEDFFKGTPISKENNLKFLEMVKSMSEAQLDACNDWLVSDERFWEQCFPGEGSSKMAEFKSKSKVEQERALGEALAKFGKKVLALVSV